jgi:hypothetical protein
MTVQTPFLSPAAEGTSNTFLLPSSALTSLPPTDLAMVGQHTPSYQQQPSSYHLAHPSVSAAVPNTRKASSPSNQSYTSSGIMSTQTQQPLAALRDLPAPVRLADSTRSRSQQPWPSKSNEYLKCNSDHQQHPGDTSSTSVVPCPSNPNGATTASTATSTVKSFLAEAGKSILANFSRNKSPETPKNPILNLSDPHVVAATYMEHLEQPPQQQEPTYLYGIPLELSVARAGSHGVPDILLCCISYIESVGNGSGLKSEGIYRIPGSARRVREWMEKFEAAALQSKPMQSLTTSSNSASGGGMNSIPLATVGPVVDLTGEGVATVASIVKRFFARLPKGMLVELNIWADLEVLINGE